MDVFHPYWAAFNARFRIMMQYRAAAVAGFVTQCWWGGIKVMIYAAFYQHSAQANLPIGLGQAITYTWLAQALFVLQPWSGDPEIAAAVRTGGIGYDRLRPVDTYAWWFVRAVAWMIARALPRAGLMFAAAAVLMPLVGLQAWSWQLPAEPVQGVLFAVSLLWMILLCAAFTVLINVCVAKTLTDRGVNTLATAFVILFSGNLIPLSFFPDWAQPALVMQPFAGMLDIPARIYIGALGGGEAWAGIAVQAFWTLAFIAIGRAWMRSVMARLEMQGG